MGLIQKWDNLVSKNSRDSLDIYNSIMASTVAGLVIAFAVAFHETWLLIFFFLIFPYLGYRGIKKILKKDKRMNKQIQLRNYIINYSIGIITGLYLSFIIISIGKPHFILKSLISGVIFMFISLALITIIAFISKSSKF